MQTDVVDILVLSSANLCKTLPKARFITMCCRAVADAVAAAVAAVSPKPEIREQ